MSTFPKIDHVLVGVVIVSIQIRAKYWTLMKSSWKA
jgi:hypothetical protein